MADLFYTILIVWVLWRIFGSSGRSADQFHHDSQPAQKKEGEVTITSVPSKDQKGNDIGEYVDYEEVK
jgi:hypothetical protein